MKLCGNKMIDLFQFVEEKEQKVTIFSKSVNKSDKSWNIIKVTTIF